MVANVKGNAYLTFEDWWAANRDRLETELRERGLVLETVAREVWERAVEECAVLAFDFPLDSTEERHSYRWSDTGKAMAWDISHAIRKKM
jgi:hypothetical protein